MNDGMKKYINTFLSLNDIAALKKYCAKRVVFSLNACLNLFPKHLYKILSSFYRKK